MPFSPMDQNDPAEIAQRYAACIYKVKLQDYTFPDTEWMLFNITGRWYADQGQIFMFDNERDAVMFALKYSH